MLLAYVAPPTSVPDTAPVSAIDAVATLFAVTSSTKAV
jgi:hypothetical protein